MKKICLIILGIMIIAFSGCTKKITDIENVKECLTEIEGSWVSSSIIKTDISANGENGIEIIGYVEYKNTTTMLLNENSEYSINIKNEFISFENFLADEEYSGADLPDMINNESTVYGNFKVNDKYLQMIADSIIMPNGELISYSDYLKINPSYGGENIIVEYDLKDNNLQLISDANTIIKYVKQ